MVRPPRRTRHLLVVLVALGLLTMTAACGLPSNSGAVQVPPAEVPYGLLDSATANPTLSVTPGVPLTAATIFLANTDTAQRLVSVDVQVPAAPLLPLVQTLLNRLAVGPSDRERSRGLVTDLGPGSTIVLRSVTNGIAGIDLQTTSQDPSASKLPVAIGQIVLTATSVEGVDRVVFVRDGAPAGVPGPTGIYTTAPLLAVDYTTLLAEGQPPVQRTVPLPGVTASPTTTTESP